MKIWNAQCINEVTIQHDIEEYPNHRVPKSEFCGVKQGGIKREVKRGKRVREGIGPEEERGWKNEGKGWEQRRPKAHSKKSDFGTLVA